MKLVIFGLTMSSSWGNGHATIWRGLCRSLVRKGHRVIFYERDVLYYAAHRDLFELAGMDLRLYPEWSSVAPQARHELADADIGMVTSYCPDGIEAAKLVAESAVQLRVFYDLDTPVTLQKIKAGQQIDYVPARGYREFDIVLSYTGGKSLDELQHLLGARTVFPLYGCVDPDVHRRVAPVDSYRAALSYLGTYAEDRQELLQELFLEPARRLPKSRFVLGGSLYPQNFPWGGNIFYFNHVPPPEHPAFYSSAGITLNITRGVMAECGYCPSGRLFEAAACGSPILSDAWEGLDCFFTPGAEILTAATAQQVIDAMCLSDSELKKIACAARERTLEEHTAERRVEELEEIAAGSRGGHSVCGLSAAQEVPCGE